MSKVQEVLLKAKELVKDPANWMQGDFTNTSGTCFCALGAVAIAKGCAFEVAHATTAAETLKEVVKGTFAFQSASQNFAAYNDSATHAEVMSAFDKAIERAKYLNL